MTNRRIRTKSFCCVSISPFLFLLIHIRTSRIFYHLNIRNDCKVIKLMGNQITITWNCQPIDRIEKPSNNGWLWSKKKPWGKKDIFKSSVNGEVDQDQRDECVSLKRFGGSWSVLNCRSIELTPTLVTKAIKKKPSIELIVMRSEFF